MRRTLVRFVAWAKVGGNTKLQKWPSTLEFQIGDRIQTFFIDQKITKI